jgi:inner membrane protein
MDSLTQATLGAAVGHAVLGKKMGNKAIVIGAFAGTIPDLDIISQLFIADEIYGLVYHRGLSHSIFFTLVASPIFAWLSLRYYRSGLHEKKGTQVLWAVLWGILFTAPLAAFGAGAYYTGSSIFYGLFALTALGAIPLYRVLQRNIAHPTAIEYDPSFRTWTLMYMLAFLTHWIIDSCTAYGTQIFEPFSNYRVSFNNIAIVDPMYTVPMILGLVGAIFAQKYRTAKRWNYLGLILSTLYMGLTFGVKLNMNSVVEKSLQAQNIAYEEYITYPSIFNTVLWQTTVKAKDTYYYGNYSLFDSSPTIAFIKLPKNHQVIDKYDGHEFVEILKWFARDYYNISENEDGSLTFNILLFGVIGVPEDSDIPLDDRYVFRYEIKEEAGELLVAPDRDVERLPITEVAAVLWERIKGN